MRTRRCTVDYGDQSPPKVAVRRVDGLSKLRLARLWVQDPLGALRWVYDRYGPLVEFGFKTPFLKKQQHFVLAIGASYNERVLGDPDSFHTSGLMLPGPRDSAQRRIRRGIVSMNGADHQHYRRLLLPPLRGAAVGGLVGPIGEIIDTRIQDWPRDRVVDLWPLVKDLSEHVAIATLFGGAEICEFAESVAVANLINNHLRMVGSLQVRACPINLRGLPYWRMLRHAECVEASLASWAKRRRGKLRTNDLMSLIVNSPDERGNPPADVQITAHVATLFGASYETCQAALIWTLLLLAQHPAAAAMLLDELSTLAGDEPLSAGQLEKCNWLDAVIRESMRLLPPVPIQVRKAICDTDLIDLEIKGKTRVFLSPFLTNRLPDVYPDGDRFKPERWASIDPSQHEYLVFSAGPRTCIGYRFGLTFLKIAIARILRRYRWIVVPAARIDYKVSVTIWPSRGVPAVIYSQDRGFRANPIGGSICELVQF
jgi:cytochrome P450